MGNFVRIVSGFALLAALAACSPPQRKASQAEAPSGQAGYVAPPELIAAARGPDGGVVLTGQSAPGARVRLASPEGQTIGVTAGRDGTWSTALGPSAAPRMFALDAETDGGRVVKAEGPVMVLPAPAPPALTPRAGFGALPVGKAGSPVIVAVDYDAGGGTAVAGLSAPRATVKLLIDGTQAGSDQADDRGRFAIVAVRPVAPGEHDLQVAVGAGVDQVRAAVSAPAPLTGQFYRAQREDGRWRIDWAVTEGGVQSTLVFDERPGARP